MIFVDGDDDDDDDWSGETYNWNHVTISSLICVNGINQG